MFPIVRTMASRQIFKTQMLARGKSNWAKAWLGDQAVYPLLAILGSAVTFCSGFMIYKGIQKDVRFNKQERQQLFRD